MQADPLFSLSNRRVIVAGGASGIGRAVALALNERAGEIEIWDSNSALLEELAASTEFSGVVTRHLDVTDLASVRGVTAAALEIGPIDGLFNSVGITDQRREVLDIPQENWDRMLAVNLTGAWNLSRELGRGMVERGYGAVVHVASTNTIDPSPGIAHYCVSKAGVGMLVHSLGLEWAANGVRVNGIGPGPVMTPMTKPNLERNPALLAEWEARVPMRRFGKPEDIAGAAIFLLSDASSWMTGQVIYVDGGWLL